MLEEEFGDGFALAAKQAAWSSQATPRTKERRR